MSSCSISFPILKGMQVELNSNGSTQHEKLKLGPTALSLTTSSLGAQLQPLAF